MKYVIIKRMPYIEKNILKVLMVKDILRIGLKIIWQIKFDLFNII